MAEWASSVTGVASSREPRERFRAVAGLRPHLALLPAAPVMAVWLIWAAGDGGYFPDSWWPAAAGGVLLLLATMVGRRQVVPAGRWSAIAVVLLASLVAWTALSLLWSDFDGAGWDSTGQLIAIVSSLWVLALLPWRGVSGLAFFATWSAGVALIAAGVLASAAGADAQEIGNRFVEGRWLAPLGYPNAVAALGAMAFPAALLVSNIRALPKAVQAVFVGLAAFLLEFALLPQSRGAFIGLVLALPLLVILAPGRLRLFLRLLVVAAAVAVSIGPLYEVYTAGLKFAEGQPTRPLTAVVDDAVRAMAWSVLGAVLLGFVLALVERRVHLSSAASRRVRLGVAGILAVAAVAIAGFAIVNADRISDAVADRFESVTSVSQGAEDGDEPLDTGPRIAGNFAELRADYWRVGLNAFEAAPLVGEGAGSFEPRYTRERRLEKPSRYTHSLWLRFMAEGGVIAVLLLVASVAVLVAGLVWARRHLTGPGRALPAAAAAVLVYFIGHASVDWLEEFSLLAEVALAVPMVAIVAAAERRVNARTGGAIRRVGAVLGGLAAVALIAALCASWASARLVDRASTSNRPLGRAYADLDAAGRLNPLSARAEIREGTIAVNASDQGRARSAFRRALSREQNWYAHFELAMLDAELGRYAAAQRHIDEAMRLNSKDPFVQDVRNDIRRHRPISAARVHREIRRFVRDRFTTPTR